jgi:phosphatidylinositol dimannoside acyltransferase
VKRTSLPPANRTLASDAAARNDNLVGKAKLVRPRDILSWKFLFYYVLLPALRLLGPAGCDAVLSGLGRAVGALWLPRRWEHITALRRVRHALSADWSPEALRPELAAATARYLARDYPLDGISDAALGDQFEVEGLEPLQAALERKQGAIVVGSHLGGHIAGLHALFRLGVPLRLLVQRPGHVSAALNRQFDRSDVPYPQSGFFVRRALSPVVAVERILRARSALRDGLAVYLTADIPWDGPNSRPGRLLGQTHRFLSVWADLAVHTRVPVFLVFCNHRGGGRYALTIDPSWMLGRGDESAAVVRYFDRLERAIAADPADAVAHLLWPCYGPPARHAVPAHRPGRRVAAVPHL